MVRSEGADEPSTGAQHAAPHSIHEYKVLKQARNSAYRYLTIRPRSCVEVEQKLRDWNFPPDIVSSVIDHLIKLGYLNDEQFARQWAASRVRSRGFGRRRLEQELRNKGISRDTIKETLSTLFEDVPEAEVARKEAAKKLRTLTRFEPEVRRRRLAGFLERKGFSSEIIRAILRTVM
ncbi:MAG: regulatory protein RecX [Nitrospirae bacterium]|nr:regulatory protein RecX [Nitrospirota bacterium]NTW65793.1 regulatory protein RecX [Nitrospirota bacterium]